MKGMDDSTINNVDTSDLMDTEYGFVLLPNYIQAPSTTGVDDFAKNKDELGYENQILKRLLNDLHKYVTSHTNTEDSLFELPSTPTSDTPLASQYQQVLDIYSDYKELESDTKSAVNQLSQLLSIIVGDGEHNKLGKARRPKGIRDASELLMKDTDRQNENFQRALAALEQMKQREQKFLILEEEKEIFKNKLDESEKNMDVVRQGEAAIAAKYKKDLMEWNQTSENQRQRIVELKKKIDELFDRLSKLAGDRLTHENANITDLSDTDRPTKLSEVYSELYDNEWTDAFEELTSCRGYDEKGAIKKLLEILLTSFHRCKQLTWQRYHKLKVVAATMDIMQSIPSCEGTIYEYISGKLTIDQESQIKTIWRTTTKGLKNEALKHLQILLLTEFGISSKDNPRTSKYLAGCIELCWKMGVQEKPMHLETLAEKDDDHERIFDLDKFRAYTKSGRIVAFVVWPALFLHEGGAMLAKGIAQGCKEIDN